jgi:hypothetical protein
MSGEVVLGGSLGVLERQRHATGGLDVEAANRALTEGEPIHVMLSRAVGMDLNLGILLEAELDPEKQPFLKDHALNGIPLLPGVMGIEGFSVAANTFHLCLVRKKAGSMWPVWKIFASWRPSNLSRRTATNHLEGAGGARNLRSGSPRPSGIYPGIENTKE